MESQVGMILASLLSLVAIHGIVGYKRRDRSIASHPGETRVLSLFGLPATVLLPRIPYVAVGRNHQFRDKFKYYLKFGWDVYSEISLTGVVVYMVADADSVKEITAAKTRFIKPVEIYDSLAIYGPNILTTEHEQWKKYRKITSPSFAEKTNRFVWVQSIDVVESLFDEVWAGRESVVVDYSLDITVPLALFVLASTIFGTRMSWNESGHVQQGHTLSLKAALSQLSDGILFKAGLPSWAMGLTKGLQDTQIAYDEVGLYMREMLQERAGSLGAGTDDLFSILMQSNAEETEVNRLTEQELIGNIFIFLIAGHETSAHSFGFTFALLALYQEEQEKLYQHITSVLQGRPPRYEDIPSLSRVLAVIFESLRMFPPVNAIPKRSVEDTTLVISNQTGEKKTVPVPTGAYLILDVPGLHYNPKYWKDPHEFKPERFLTDYNRDAFLPFSAGHRACLGRTFFETEAVAIITVLVSKYKITLKDDPQHAHETFEEKKKRLFAATQGLTLLPVRTPLVFTRRS